VVAFQLYLMLAAPPVVVQETRGATLSIVGLNGC